MGLPELTVEEFLWKGPIYFVVGSWMVCVPTWVYVCVCGEMVL